MPDERGVTLIGGAETALKAIHDELNAFRLDTHGRLSGLESGFGQMDKRMSNFETTMNDLRRETRQAFFWLLGIMLTTWMGTMWAILTKIR